ncbi:MAG: hypothetical protein DRP85_01210 [Candidatus Makaraimicrobium thalassicum]|nr:MAG: hypothetical protein DRP85_01210 [Candidatus Omnitrophota bacterium]
MTGSPKADKSGAVLIITFLLTAILSVLAAATIQLTVNEYHSANRAMLTAEMYYLAEAGTEKIVYELAIKVANYQSEPAGATDAWPALCGQETDFCSSGFTMDHTCRSLDAEAAEVQPSGIVSFKRHYQITAQVTDPDSGSSVTVNQVIARNKTYAFQHAVFYTDDLEILPGPSMTLSGKVHSNRDIYLDTGATLTVDTDYLRGAGNIYKKRKNDGSESSGDVRIWNKATSSYRSMREAGDIDPLDCDRGDWTDESQNRWGGTVKSSIHGVTSLATPAVASIQPDGYYAGKADVKVINGQIYANGTLLVEGVPDADGNLPPGTDIPAGTVTTTSSFYNWREGKFVRMTTIDVEKLAGWGEYVDAEGTVIKKQFTNYLPGNGLLYATRDTFPAAEQPGIRLINGSEIQSSSGTGLTVVSNNPVYVQGDYNATAKKPAAVICDAFNILSNNWDDTNSPGGLASRIAAETTVNTAIISGIVPTVGGVYSGGLENLPRFHESWSGKTLHVRGSFVVLWDSETATGAWAYGGNYYKAPGRDWHYDTDFNNSANLPAFTPFAVETRRVALWKT